MTGHPDDIPSYGRFPGTERPSDGGSEPSPNAEIRARIVKSVLSASRHLLIALGRDFERCGKAACRRTRRCRGIACEPELGEPEPASEPKDRDEAAPGSAEFKRRVAMIEDELAQSRARRAQIEAALAKYYGQQS